MKDMAEFVTVRTFANVPDAYMARTVLQAAGLDARLRDEHIVSMQWLYSNAVGGVKLEVPAEQAEEATALLETPAQVAEHAVFPDDDRCLQCGSMEVASVLWGGQPAVLTWLLAGVPLFPVRRLRRCRRCGATLPASGRSA